MTGGPAGISEIRLPTLLGIVTMPSAGCPRDIFRIAAAIWWCMDRSKYWNDRLSMRIGLDWDEHIFLTNEDGIGRPATSSELREAAQYLAWVRRHLGRGSGG